jgi:hypothetical protein
MTGSSFRGASATSGTDLTWLVTHGAGMAWQYALEVQSCLNDIEAAYAAGDHGTCLESCAAALRGMVYCERVGRGYVGRPSNIEHHLFLALENSPAAIELRALPKAGNASNDDCRVAMAVVREQNERLLALLPMTLPSMRSAGGFFRVLGIANALETLRDGLGLQPIDWEQWGL